MCETKAQCTYLLYRHDKMLYARRSKMPSTTTTIFVRVHNKNAEMAIFRFPHMQMTFIILVCVQNGFSTPTASVYHSKWKYLCAISLRRKLYEMLYILLSFCSVLIKCWYWWLYCISDRRLKTHSTEKMLRTRFNFLNYIRLIFLHIIFNHIWMELSYNSRMHCSFQWC